MGGVGGGATERHSCQAAKKEKKGVKTRQGWHGGSVVERLSASLQLPGTPSVLVPPSRTLSLSLCTHFYVKRPSRPSATAN